MRRLLPFLVGLVVVVGGGVVLLSVFHSRDAAGVAADAPADLGRQEPDRGSAVRAGAGVRKFTLPPPSSGPHARRPPDREGRLDDAQLLSALALGNVALVYGDARPPAALRAVQREVAPFEPAVAAAGQAVLLVRRPGVDGVVALAWRHRLVTTADDAALGDFAQTWLGRAAPG